MSTEPSFRLSLIALAALTACGEDGTNPLPGGDTEFTCTIDVSELHDGGVGRDGIPALTDPMFVNAGDANAEYLLPTDRVIGFEFGGGMLAIPHNILWWHEIVNLSFEGTNIAVTYCPLTGTAMAFDRAPVGGAELGVSGLLYRNNLVMYDRSGAEETLFSQILGEGVCGFRKQTLLPRIAVWEMTWEVWKYHFPQTLVVSSSTGYGRDYSRYPYGNYEELDEPPFLPQQYDRSRKPKERVVGIEGPNGGFLAVPYLELDKLGAYGVVNLELDGVPLVVVWDRMGQSGTTFSRLPTDGPQRSDDPLTFTIDEFGRLFDVETGSEWTLTGRAIGGALEGASMDLHAHSMIAFWFAWSAFHSETEVWIQS